MVGIPKVLPSDPEDVVWALQTAEALWKRDERADAIVWLRRAAQACGEAELDERALVLSRTAAELTDMMAEANSEVPIITDDEEAVAIAVHEIDGNGESDSLTNRDALGGRRVDEHADVHTAAATDAGADASHARPISESSFKAEAMPAFLADELAAAPLPGEFPPPRAPAPAARPAPPAQAPAAPLPNTPPAKPRAAPPPLPPRAKVQSQGATPAAPPVSRGPDSGRFAMRPAIESLSEVVEVPEVVPVVDVRQSLAPALEERIEPAPAAYDPERTPMVSRNQVIRAEEAARDQERMEGPFDSADDSAREVEAVASRDSDTDVGVHPAAPQAAPDYSAPMLDLAALLPSRLPASMERISDAAPAADVLKPTMALHLDALDAFADLPDDLRESFQAAADIRVLREGEGVPSFGLLVVLAGEVDVAGQAVQTSAVRLSAGQVLYGRGSIEAEVAMRLVAASDIAEVAVWSRAEVDLVMKSCSWVEDDLRSACDPVLAAVGLTLGPFGDRLDANLRSQVTSRMSVQSLAEGDIVIEAGIQVPGLFVVGAGQVELVDGSDIKGVLGPGDVLFPAEVFGGGLSKAAARAARCGALVLSCDRHAAQELFMTCPPLLEILAGA